MILLSLGAFLQKNSEAQIERKSRTKREEKG